MPLVTRTFPFEAAHRILGHCGKCKFVHGHSYKAEVEVHADRLNALGMVVDFADLKATVGDWIKESWDHNLILQDTDPLVTAYAHSAHLIGWGQGGPKNGDIFAGRAPYQLSVPPTAEALAQELLFVSDRLLAGRFDNSPRVVRVTVWEQADACATATRPGWAPARG